MPVGRTATALVTPYTFVIDLGSYRDRGRVPADSGDPYFYMVLLDQGHDSASPEFIERHRGRHPMDERYSGGISIWCNPAELERWRDLQNSVLTAMRGMEAQLIHDLDTTTEPGSAILQRCSAQIRAVGAEHQAIWAEMNARINANIAGREGREWPVAREDTPERQAVRKRNEKYGRGYPTGGFRSI